MCRSVWMSPAVRASTTWATLTIDGLVAVNYRGGQADEAP